MNKRMTYTQTDLTTRISEDGDIGFIEGYFAVFDRETELWPGAFEEIAPGAFRHSLSAKDDILCLDNHSKRAVLGSTGSQTLTLEEDATGLYGKVELDLADPMAMSAYRKVKTGKVRGCSFGFYPTKEETMHLENGDIKWRVQECDLVEVSITAFPAYKDTTISSRKKEYESYQRERLEHWREKAKERLDGTKNFENA